MTTQQQQQQQQQTHSQMKMRLTLVKPGHDQSSTVEEIHGDYSLLKTQHTVPLAQKRRWGLKCVGASSVTGTCSGSMVETSPHSPDMAGCKWLSHSTTTLIRRSRSGLGHEIAGAPRLPRIGGHCGAQRNGLVGGLAAMQGGGGLC
jgi:hypothetical protein